MKNKANKTLGFIKRNLHSFPERIQAQAYVLLVRPTLEYACASWDLYRKYQMDILEQVQRRAARFVTKTYSRDEGCVSQDNYSSIYIGQPQEANSKVMHGLQNT